MTFVSSTAPDITEGLPAGLSQNADASSTLKRGGIRWDVSIAGIGFILAANDQNPYLRESAPVQKQQFDASTEAGEQTLEGLWIRSQTSWHSGAGVRFYEPGGRDAETNTSFRFSESLGVDVWTEGELSLLKSVSNAAAVSAGQAAFVTGAVVGGADVIFTNENGTVKRRLADGTVGATYTGATNLATRVAVAGAKVLAGHATGIAAADATGSVFADLWTQASGTVPTPYWAKSRIIASRGVSLYELTLAGGDLDAATPLYTHPDTGWTWSGVAEGPTAIYAAGYGNGHSYIYAFSLQDAASGSSPELGQAYQVVELPSGEEIRSIHATLGTFLGVGTTRGMRVAAILSDGGLAMGPLLFNSDEPVVSIASGDRFLYGVLEAGHPDGNTGAVRVDLSLQIGSSSSLRFPYAWDARPGVLGTPTSVALLGSSSRVCLAITGAGVYTQSATAYEAEGYLLSGAIRYGTTESKAFRFADVRCSTGDGSGVVLSAVVPSGSEVPLVTLANGQEGSNLSLATLVQNLEHLSYKLTLSATTDNTGSPTVASVALKAVPFVRKQRVLRYPVQIFEKMQDGARTSFSLNVPDTIRRIEEAEDTSAVVRVHDYRMGETFDAVIESFRFIGSTPSTGSTKRGGANAGGRGEITVRRL